MRAVMTEQAIVKLVEDAKTPEQKREVRVYTMIVGTWMVCLILFGVVQLLGWIRV
jgi:hypothetical protein